MATCGYVCPLCEGRGVDEHGVECQWCKPLSNAESPPPKPELDEEWTKSVHEGKCCSDE